MTILTWPLSASPFCGPLILAFSLSLSILFYFSLSLSQSLYVTSLHHVLFSPLLLCQPIPSQSSHLISFSTTKNAFENENCRRLHFRYIPSMGRTPSTAGTFRKKFRKNSGKTPETLSERFPGIPVESTAGIPQTLLFKAFEASRAFPEFSPPQYGWGRLFFQKWFRRGPLRAGHGIPSSTGGISDSNPARTLSREGGTSSGQDVKTARRSPSQRQIESLHHDSLHENAAYCPPTSFVVSWLFFSLPSRIWVS